MVFDTSKYWCCSYCFDPSFIRPELNVDCNSKWFTAPKYDTKEELNEHKKTETHKQIVKSCYCESCKFQCMSLASYSDHVREKHTNKVQYRCETCDKAFDYPSKLKEHQHTKAHQDKEEGKEAETLHCDLCDYTAKDKQHYHQHVGTKKHQDKVNGVEKQKYSCCGYSFNCESDYNRHLLSKKHSQRQK